MSAPRKKPHSRGKKRHVPAPLTPEQEAYLRRHAIFAKKMAEREKKRVLDEQDACLAAGYRDFRAALAKLFVDPVAAEAAWNDRVEVHGSEAACEDMRLRPMVYGELRTRWLRIERRRGLPRIMINTPEYPNAANGASGIGRAMERLRAEIAKRDGPGSAPPTTTERPR